MGEGGSAAKIFHSREKNCEGADNGFRNFRVRNTGYSGDDGGRERRGVYLRRGSRVDPRFWNAG
jgi:hypothetical protein